MPAVRVSAEIQLPVLDIVTFSLCAQVVCLLRTLILLMKTSLLRSKHLPKVLPFNTITWGGGLNFKIWIMEEHKHSVYSTVVSHKNVLFFPRQVKTQTINSRVLSESLRFLSIKNHFYLFLILVFCWSEVPLSWHGSQLRGGHPNFSSLKML